MVAEFGVCHIWRRSNNRKKVLELLNYLHYSASGTIGWPHYVTVLCPVAVLECRLMMMGLGASKRYTKDEAEGKHSY